MKNKLTFSTIYKSITQLSEIELPNLVVLTGRNGSGKTHLLEAIKNGSIKSSLVADLEFDVLSYNWNDIIPKDTGIFHPFNHLTTRSTWFSQLRDQQEKYFPAIRQSAIKLGLPAEYCTNFQKLKNIDMNKLEEIFSSSKVPINLLEELQKLIAQYTKNVSLQAQSKVGDDNFKKIARKVANESPELFLETSETKFFNNDKFLWGEVDPFQQAFGQLFTTYRELIHYNDRLERYPPENDIDQKYLNKDEFVSKFGEPPWAFVNKILEVCNLDFRVIKPPLHETSSYEARLKKISADVEMKFQDLSSGEKVLMSFALCLYNINDKRQAKAFPKLLLLDEIDAPLHPSMVLSLLKTIKNVLVDKKGIFVILTTHSPSTVALASEDTIFEMNPIGPSIDKIGKNRALSILTSGVPTLSVSFDGRRQVFVESNTDAIIYEMLYQQYKSDLNSEKSLAFISVGNFNSSGVEQNSGCGQVKNLVSSLTKNGNMSVFGLVDWDGTNESTSRLKVLSIGVRNGIESLIFDPVLIATTAIKENLNFCIDKNILNKGESYVEIGNWNQDKWQHVVNVVQDLILGKKSETKENIEIKYLNGMSIQVKKYYIHLDDHELEKKIISAFGFLTSKNKNAGGLMKHIVASILSDFPKIVPSDLLSTFKDILDAPI